MGGDDSNEKPIHSVTIRPFSIGRYTVTREEWQDCVLAGACSYSPPASSNPREPVHNISWTDAQQYVTWIAKLTGLPYRLPSESEWEYAARAGTTSKFYWGETIAPKMAHCKGCGSSTDISGPLPVGSFPPNAFGLFDMSGNVDQWVADCFHRNYQGAPVDGSAWKEPNCRSRVLRGGSWRSDPTYLHSAARASYDTDVRYLTNGLRVARSQ